ncbi:MAG TPA: AraC family transcriptional regulator ligand-binding domain-containing protein [Polyangiales bacterium]
MLGSAGLSWQSILDRTSPRIPQRLSVKMLDMSIALTGDAALGLHGAEASQPGDLELLEYLVRSCTTVGESLEVWRRYIPVVLDADFEVMREGKQSVGRLRFAPDLLVNSALIDYSLALATLLTLRNARDPNPRALQLQLSQPRPAYAAEYERILGHMPRFGQSYDGIIFSPQYEHTLMADPDPVLHLLLSRQVQTELDAIQRHRSFSGRVREAITRMLPRGAPLPLVARELGASTATLRRKLVAHGTSYRVLLEQTRRDGALRALEGGQLPVSQIAFNLGYNHASAFDRAFKRWYGRSPTEHRESLNQRSLGLIDSELGPSG